MSCIVGWLCSTSDQQLGHLETAPPFICTVPCEGHEAQFYTVPTGNRTPDCCVVVHFTTAAPGQFHTTYIANVNHLHVTE